MWPTAWPSYAEPTNALFGFALAVCGRQTRRMHTRRLIRSGSHLSSRATSAERESPQVGPTATWWSAGPHRLGDEGQSRTFTAAPSRRSGDRATMERVHHRNSESQRSARVTCGAGRPTPRSRGEVLLESCARSSPGAYRIAEHQNVAAVEGLVDPRDRAGSVCRRTLYVMPYVAAGRSIGICAGRSSRSRSSTVIWRGARVRRHA